LEVDSNALNGSVPDWLGGMVKLNTLSLADNQLSGALPASLVNLLPQNGGSLRSFNATPGGMNLTANWLDVASPELVAACSNQTFTDDDDCGADDCDHHDPRVEEVCALTPQRSR
jgi:hypothetical protein